MDIRDATAADRPALIAALDDLMVSMTPRDPYLVARKPDFDHGAWVDTYLSDSDGRGLMVDDDAGCAACALGRLQDPAIPVSAIGRVGFIAMVWVAERSRRQGLARRLCAEFESWFKQRGAAWVELVYLSANHEAVATWSELGFEPFRIEARKAL